MLVPTSIDRCTRAPPPREAPNNPNNDASCEGQQQPCRNGSDAPNTRDEPVVVQNENDTSGQIVSDPVHNDAKNDELLEKSPYFIRIVDHTNHNDGRVTYNVQLSDRTVSREVDVNELPYRSVIQYWHKAINPKRNPHTRKRGRPRKKRNETREDAS